MVDRWQGSPCKVTVGDESGDREIDRVFWREKVEVTAIMFANKYQECGKEPDSPLVKSRESSERAVRSLRCSVVSRGPRGMFHGPRVPRVPSTGRIQLTQTSN